MNNEDININQDKFWFIGPNAENVNLFKQFIVEAFEDHCYWRKNFNHKELVLIKESERSSDEFQDVISIFRDNFNELTSRLKTSVPQFSSRYLGHMLPDPTFPATLGAFLGLLTNNNNTTTEAAPTTITLEFEALRMLCEMFNYGRLSWGHLTTGGTYANMHCLWRARDLAFYPYVLAVTAKLGSNEIKHVLGHIKLAGRGSIHNMIESNTIRVLTVNERIELLRQVLELSLEYSFLLPALHENSVYELGFFEFMKRGKKVLKDRFPKNFWFVVNKAVHYSIIKSVNILGFGKSHIIPVSLDNTGSMCSDNLAEILEKIYKKNEEVIAVVNIFGSTEIGNIDDIEMIVKIREKFNKEGKGDFWLHTDAAWGGYFTTLLRRGNSDRLVNNWELQNYLHSVLEELFPQVDDGLKESWNESIANWVCLFLRRANAINKSDSITIDPHKSGYIPYPAGACLFKNYLVREIVTYNSSYINAKNVSQDEEDEIIWNCPLISKYTLDGSRSSSPAVSIWLAHKTIPLDKYHHGILMAKMVIASMYLQKVLARDVITNEHGDTVQYIFYNKIPITGIVCYTLKISYQGRIISLKEVNQIMNKIYQDTALDKNTNVYEKNFFIAFTRLDSKHYADEANQFLENNGIPGRVVEHKENEGKYNPWEDDNHLSLFRNVTINPFFLIHKVMGENKDVLHLAHEYAKYLASNILSALDVIAKTPNQCARKVALPCKLIILESGKVLSQLISEQIQKTYRIEKNNIFVCRDVTTAWNVILRHQIEVAVLGVDLGPNQEKQGIEFLKRLADLPFFRGGIVFTSYEKKDILSGFQEAKKMRDDWEVFYLQHFDLDSKNINYVFRRLVSLLWKVFYNPIYHSLNKRNYNQKYIKATEKYFLTSQINFLQTINSISDNINHPLRIILDRYGQIECKKYYLMLEDINIYKNLYRTYLLNKNDIFKVELKEFVQRFYLTDSERVFLKKILSCWKEHDIPWYLYEERFNAL